MAWIQRAAAWGLVFALGGLALLGGLQPAERPVAAAVLMATPGFGNAPTATPTPARSIAIPTATPTAGSIAIPPTKTATSTPLGIGARSTSTPTRTPGSFTVPTATNTPLPIGALPTVTPVPTLPILIPTVLVKANDIEPLRIELVQATTRTGYSVPDDLVPLIAGKTSLLRVWVDLTGPADSYNVQVQLRAFRGNQELPGCFLYTEPISRQLSSPGVPVFDFGRPTDLSKTYNWVIPRWCNWLDSGPLRIEAKVIGLECGQCLGNNVITRTFSLVQMRAMKAKLNLVYVDGKGPPPSDMLDAMDAIYSRYPISDVDITWGYTVLNSILDGIDFGDAPADEVDFDDPMWEGYVALRSFMIDCCSDDDVDVHYGGVHKDYVGCWGLAGGGWALSGASCGGTYAHEGGHAFGLDHASTNHGECGGGACDDEFPFSHGGLNNVGWDDLLPDKFVGISGGGWHSHDTMSYGGCAAGAPKYDDAGPTFCRSWLSTLNYSRIAHRLYCADPQDNIPGFFNLAGLIDYITCWQQTGPFAKFIQSPWGVNSARGVPQHLDASSVQSLLVDHNHSHDTGPLGWLSGLVGLFTGASHDHEQEHSVVRPATIPARLHATSLRGQVVRVSGNVAGTGAVTLNPIYVVDNAPARVRGAVDGANELVLEDGSGQVLRRVPFDFEQVQIHTDVAAPPATFVVAAPWHPDTQTVKIVRGGQVLAERTASANAPQVRLVSPNGGERWGGSGPETVTWEASDADGDPLAFWLEYSRDGGTTWKTVFRNTRETSHTLQLEVIPGSTNLRLRVHASDGLLTAVDETDAPLQSEDKAPVVSISGARDEGFEGEAGAAFDLRGIAFDFEDGMLTGAALGWASDLQGPLGEGDTLRVPNLRAGEHTITLTARDSTGKTGTASARLFVRTAGLELLSPRAGQMLPSLTADLRWTAPTGATTMHLQLIPANNDGPGIDLLLGDQGLIQSGRYTIAEPRFRQAGATYLMLPGMSYTWRARYATTAGPPQERDWSAWASESFRTPDRTAGTITLVEPPSGAIVSTLTPTLTWQNSDTSVFYYEVQVSKDPSFNTNPSTATASVYWVLIHGALSTPPLSYAVPASAPLEPATEYFWRVRPRIQGDGVPADWTPAGAFRTP